MGTEDKSEPLFRCARCWGMLPGDAFHVSRKNPNGLHRWCKECRRAAARGEPPARPEATVPEGHKRCSVCEENLPLTAFRSQLDTRSGLASACRECEKVRRAVRSLQGRTPDEVASLLRRRERRRTPVPPGCRVCAKCAEVKNLDDFYSQRGKKTSRCKACAAAAVRERNLRNLDWGDYLRRHDREQKKQAAPDGYKWCPGCDTTLPVGEFHTHRRASDGLTWVCRVCAKERMHEYYRDNRELVRAKAVEYRALNGERIRAQARERYAALSDEEKARGFSRLLAWGAENPEKARESRRRSQARNRGKYALARREWIERNRHKVRARLSKVRAAKRAVGWADPTKIALAYWQARTLSSRQGEPYEVDHIIPLHHPRMCGLHVENNLLPVPRAVNQAKGNKPPAALLGELPDDIVLYEGEYPGRSAIDNPELAYDT